jgi:putative copper resistance protein D
MSALVAVRFVHFAMLMMVFGACMFRPFMLIHPAQKGRLRNLLDPLVCLMAGLALISAVGWLVLVAQQMGGALNMDVMRKVIGETFFGKVWSLHLVLCIALLVCLRIPGERMAVIARPISALALATLAPVGHGAMLDGLAGQLLVVNQMIHLLCAGAWLGALMVLLFLLAKPNGQDLQALMLRFSGVGLMLVIGLLVTGLINVRVLTGSFWPMPGQSAFASVLAVKAALVMCMLGFAWHHRASLHKGPMDLASVKRTVMLEWTCGIAALLAVSLLGTLAPVPLS